jgi:hypothetical protein
MRATDALRVALAAIGADVKRRQRPVTQPTTAEAAASTIEQDSPQLPPHFTVSFIEEQAGYKSRDTFAAKSQYMYAHQNASKIAARYCRAVWLT